MHGMYGPTNTRRALLLCIHRALHTVRAYVLGQLLRQEQETMVFLVRLVRMNKGKTY